MPVKNHFKCDWCKATFDEGKKPKYCEVIYIDCKKILNIMEKNHKNVKSAECDPSDAVKNHFEGDRCKITSNCKHVAEVHDEKNLFNGNLKIKNP